MTYCVGMRLDRGLVFMSDTRTNSGVDNISTFSKMHRWVVPGDRVITVMSAGNLATTQSVISTLDERSKAPADRHPSILEVPTMFQVANLVGEVLRAEIDQSSPGGQRADGTFDATLILGGQIAGIEPRLFLIYPEGNFIEASADTPFLQIGETKYGRPILVRAYRPDMSFEEAIKLLMVSFDSTLKANLSVGLPIEYDTYEADRLDADPIRRIEADDPAFADLSRDWGEALRNAFDALPLPPLD